MGFHTAGTIDWRLVSRLSHFMAKLYMFIFYFKCYLCQGKYDQVRSLKHQTKQEESHCGTVCVLFLTAPEGSTACTCCKLHASPARPFSIHPLLFMPPLHVSQWVVHVVADAPLVIQGGNIKARQSFLLCVSLPHTFLHSYWFRVYFFFCPLLLIRIASLFWALGRPWCVQTFVTAGEERSRGL